MDNIKFQYKLIDSIDRLNGSDRVFSYEIKLDDDYEYVSCLQFFMPKSWYMIDSTNNTFSLNEGAGNMNVVLSIGSYNRRQLKTELQTQLNATGAYTYVVDIDATTEPDTGKYYFTVSDNATQPSITLNNSQLAEIIGFNNNTTNTFVADALESTNVINLIKENAVILHANIVEGGLLQEIYTSSTIDYGSITYINPSPLTTAKKITSKSNTIIFSITNEHNNILQSLNGGHVIFSLIFFKYIYTNRDLMQLLANIYSKLSELESIIKNVSTKE